MHCSIDSSLSQGLHAYSGTIHGNNKQKSSHVTQYLLLMTFITFLFSRLSSYWRNCLYWFMDMSPERLQRTLWGFGGSPAAGVQSPTWLLCAASPSCATTLCTPGTCHDPLLELAPAARHLLLYYNRRSEHGSGVPCTGSRCICKHIGKDILDCEEFTGDQIALNYAQGHLQHWEYDHLPVYRAISSSIPYVIKHPALILLLMHILLQFSFLLMIMKTHYLSLIL